MRSAAGSSVQLSSALHANLQLQHLARALTEGPCRKGARSGAVLNNSGNDVCELPIAVCGFHLRAGPPEYSTSSLSSMSTAYACMKQAHSTEKQNTPLPLVHNARMPESLRSCNDQSCDKIPTEACQLAIPCRRASHMTRTNCARVPRHIMTAHPGSEGRPVRSRPSLCQMMVSPCGMAGPADQACSVQSLGEASRGPVLDITEMTFQSSSHPALRGPGRRLREVVSAEVHSIEGHPQYACLCDVADRA